MEKMTKAQVQAAMQAKKDAKIAEQLALKAKKAAAKHMTKAKPVVEHRAPTASAEPTRKGCCVAKDFDSFGKISNYVDAEAY
jgi:hypothetical protein